MKCNEILLIFSLFFLPRAPHSQKHFLIFVVFEIVSEICFLPFHLSCAAAVSTTVSSDFEECLFRSSVSFYTFTLDTEPAVLGRDFRLTTINGFAWNRRRA